MVLLPNFNEGYSHVAIIVEVKVVPSSGRSECKLEAAGKLKCYVKAPPENGKANKELIKMLAKMLGISSGDIDILSGETSRNKRVKIDLNISFEELLARMGIERQMGLF